MLVFEGMDSISRGEEELADSKYVQLLFTKVLFISYCPRHYFLFIHLGLCSSLKLEQLLLSPLSPWCAPNEDHAKIHSRRLMTKIIHNISGCWITTCAYTVDPTPIIVVCTTKKSIVNRSTLIVKAYQEKRDH